MPSIAPNEKDNQVVQLDDSGDFKSIKIGSDISSSDVVRQEGDGGDVEIETDDIFIEDDIDKVIQRFRPTVTSCAPSVNLKKWSRPWSRSSRTVSKP